ncbi:MAG: putative toxin-antitoxin system toxin component, PIN family [Acidobacteria bacterium]|nr:MAG: putative toxin-antitoxin system toxin component, PIN family [Acidobacteriota bacterium]PYU31094.1 MAG: putative toxin-antitoxin system toxin component, PIN family [Acidobacteriota bacterium]
MRRVFDTSVIVSALLLLDSKPRQALDLALQKGKVLLSFPVLAELYEVLGRKRLRRYIDEEDVRIFLAALTREAQWVDVDVQIAACRDSKDNKFLELAVSGHATHIVTGDSDLLALDPFQGIQILPPHSFLELSLPPASQP